MSNLEALIQAAQFIEENGQGKLIDLVLAFSTCVHSGTLSLCYNVMIVSGVWL